MVWSSVLMSKYRIMPINFSTLSHCIISLSLCKISFQEIRLLFFLSLWHSKYLTISLDMILLSCMMTDPNFTLLYIDRSSTTMPNCSINKMVRVRPRGAMWDCALSTKDLMAHLMKKRFNGLTNNQLEDSIGSSSNPGITTTLKGEKWKHNFVKG